MGGFPRRGEGSINSLGKEGAHKSGTPGGVIARSFSRGQGESGAGFGCLATPRNPPCFFSAFVRAALTADSVLERALLRAEEVDVFALSPVVDVKIAEVPVPKRGHGGALFA